MSAMHPDTPTPAECLRFIPSKDPVRCEFCAGTWIQHSGEVRKNFVDQSPDMVIMMVEHRHSFKAQENPAPCEAWRPVRYGEDLVLCECGRLIFEHKLGRIIKHMRQEKESTATTRCTETLQLPIPGGEFTVVSCLLDANHAGNHEHHSEHFSGTWTLRGGVPVIASSRGTPGRNQCAESYKVAEGSFERCVLGVGHPGQHSTYGGRKHWTSGQQRPITAEPPATPKCGVEFRRGQLATTCDFPYGHLGLHSWATIERPTKHPVHPMSGRPICGHTYTHNTGLEEVCEFDPGHSGYHSYEIIEQCGEINPWQDPHDASRLGYSICTRTKGHTGHHRCGSSEWLQDVDANTPSKPHWCRAFVPLVDTPGVCKWCSHKYIQHEPGGRGLELEFMLHMHSPGCLCRTGPKACTCMDDKQKQAFLDTLAEAPDRKRGMVSCRKFDPNNPQQSDLCKCGARFYRHELSTREGFGSWTEWRAANMSNADIIQWFVGLGTTPTLRMIALESHMNHPSAMDPFAPPPAVIKELWDLLPDEVKRYLPKKEKPKQLPSAKQRPKGNGVTILRSSVDGNRTTCFNCSKELTMAEHSICKSCQGLLTASNDMASEGGAVLGEN